MKEQVEQLIIHAIEQHATDIHFITQKEHVAVKLRIEGEMMEASVIPHGIYDKMLAYLKFISRLDISDKKKAQSGVMELSCNDIDYHIRISTLPQSVGQEACVLRLLPAEFRQSMDAAPSLRQLMKLSAGLLLITGPTGSGKSTLMYHLLTYARDQLNRHIITIEDPVEQQLEGTVQVNVNEKADITYHNSIKAILRCDPDIIMIGEIRDSDTARHVINASLSGHLVLSTMHAGDAAGAVERLLEMGITQSELYQSIIAITNQRLVKLHDRRKLVIEQISKSQLKAVLEGRRAEQFHSLDEQIQSLYDQQQISLRELEKFYVGD